MATTEARRSRARAKTRDPVTGELLNLLQKEFPVVSRPFLALGERLGIAESEVIERVAAAKKAGIIRQLSAIFDTRRLGYKSSLVAMAFAPEDLVTGARIINRHPGVSHNYEREHPFNLWFTIAVPPDRSLEEDVQQLARLAGARETLLLPTIKLFKIGVDLDMTGTKDPARRERETPYGDLNPRRHGPPPPLTGEDKAFVRLFQEDLPLVPEPFRLLAEKGNTTEERLFALWEAFLARGQARRFAAVLRHRQAGFVANGMGVWVVPDERIDEIGTVMASFAAVSHCYQRPPRLPHWPYTLFTMVHARTKEECWSILRSMSEASGITEYSCLFSIREFKKTRVKYMVEDEYYRREGRRSRPDA